MTLETDLLIDRRRLKRRLIAWQSLAILAVVAAVLVGLRGGGIGRGGAHVERVRVSGIILDDPKLERAIRKLAKEPSVKAVVVSIDSPGGSVAGGESVHDAIASVAVSKPVVAVMGAMATSAGYMVATPAARIFARRGTLTGSIGVFLQTFEVSGLLGKLGITSEVTKSGPLKAEPNPFEPLSPEGRQMLQGLVTDFYDQFVTIVAEGRHMAPEKVRALADGRPYTGEQALTLGLVDAIGGEEAARAWLAQTHGVPTSLPTTDLEQRGLVARSLSGSLEWVGNELAKILISQGVILDGAWSLWHGAGD